MDHVTIGQKIILHLMRFNNMVYDDMNAPYDLTQDGIGAVVGKKRAHVSIEMKKLLNTGKVTCWKSHILGSCTRRNVYRLTEKGYKEGIEITEFLKGRDIDPEMLLDMKRCNPSDMWKTLSDEDRDTLGKACVLRTPVPRRDLPRTAMGTIPVDSDGRICLPRAVAQNYLTFAEPYMSRDWHSWAADYWMSKGDVAENLFHLVKANRMRDAGLCVSNHWEDLAATDDEDVLRNLKKIVPDPAYAGDVYSLIAVMSVEMGDFDEALRATDRLSSLSTDGWREVRAEVLLRSGHPKQSLELAAEAYDVKPTALSAAIASMAASSTGDTDAAERYAGLAFDNVEHTGDGDNLDMVFAARARLAEMKGDTTLALNMVEQATRMAPGYRKNVMNRMRKRIEGSGADRKEGV